MIRFFLLQIETGGYIFKIVWYIMSAYYSIVLL
nr:MAG TPA: hypothetical protein [Bacteriophage sp.]